MVWKQIASRGLTISVGELGAKRALKPASTQSLEAVN
jgi:hypothetical protein